VSSFAVNDPSSVGFRTACENTSENHGEKLTRQRKKLAEKLGRGSIGRHAAESEHCDLEEQMDGGGYRAGQCRRNAQATRTGVAARYGRRSSDKHRTNISSSPSLGAPGMWVTGHARAIGARAPVALHVHETRGAVATRADPPLYRIPLRGPPLRLKGAIRRPRPGKRPTLPCLCVYNQTKLRTLRKAKKSQTSVHLLLLARAISLPISPRLTQYVCVDTTQDLVDDNMGTTLFVVKSM